VVWIYSHESLEAEARRVWEMDGTSAVAMPVSHEVLRVPT